MKNLRSNFYSIILSSSFLLLSCGGSGENDTSNTSSGNQTLSSAAKTSIINIGDTDCPNGGVLVETGIDENANGILNDNEVDTSEKLCHGSSGLNALVSQTVETAGVNCNFGGVRFDVGIDNNKNDTLDLTEISSTEYMCNIQSALSTNARLDGIQLSIGQLDQTFQSSQLSYTASVGYLVSEITIQSFTEDENANVTVTNSFNANFIISQSALGAVVFVPQDTSTFDVVVTAQDGSTTRTYSLTLSRSLSSQFSERDYLKASNTESFDFFGRSMDASANTVVIGAPGEDGRGSDNGAVYVFVKDSGIWHQQAYISSAIVGKQFGHDVAVYGDTLAVGVPLSGSTNSGVVYIYNRHGNSWDLEEVLSASTPGAGDFFGHRVALSKDTLIVSANTEDSDSVGVNGVENNDNTSNSGAAYVFTRNNTTNTWSQQAYLKASNPLVNAFFGSSVDIENDTVVVGARQESGLAVNSGAAYVFTRSGNSWTQQGYIKAPNVGLDDNFGFDVALSGDILAVSAINEDTQGENAGAVYLFTRTANAWSQGSIRTASSGVAGDVFGYSIDLSPSFLAISSPLDSGNFNNQGSTYLYESGDGYQIPIYLTASNFGLDDNFGHQLAISGDSLLISAYLEDSDATGINGESLNNNSSGSGAVYSFH